MSYLISLPLSWSIFVYKWPHLSVTLTVEELLAALTSAGWGFGAGLGVGLDTRAEALLHGEWGGIRVTQEGVSEDEYEQ